MPPGFGQDVRELQNRKQPWLNALSSTLTSPPPAGLNHHPEPVFSGSRPSSAMDYERNFHYKDVDESHRHENGLDDSHDRIHHLTPDPQSIHRCSSPVINFSSQNRYKSDSNLYPGGGGHNHNLVGQHVLSVSMFSKEHLNEIFNLAQTMRAFVLKERNLDHILKVKLPPILEM